MITVADRRRHPATIMLRFLKEAPSTVLALPAGLAFIADANLWRVVWIAAAVAALVIFFNWLGWMSFRYGVGETEVVIESGILHRNRRSIPFERIQDVDIERSLLARLFGLAKVRIETGAGGKDEGVLDSVRMEEADRLRAAVRAWRLGSAEGTADDAQPGMETARQAEAGSGRTLFSMDIGRVLLFGVFSFSLVYIASLFALLQAFDQFLPFDIYDPGRWVGLVDEALPRRFTAAAIGALLFFAVLLGFVAGVLRTLSRDYGFRLSVEGDRFRRERGLLTRSEAVIAKRRVQLAFVRTGPIRRAFGWFALSFQTLGAGSDGSGLQVAAPFARRGEMEPILAETEGLRLPPPLELSMVSSRHVLRALIHHLALPSGAIVIAGLARPEAFYLVALLPLRALAATIDRRFHRYALDGPLLFVTRGIWRQQLWAIPLTSVQAVSLARGPLQRQLGVATLSIDTAGAPITQGARIIDLRLETARELAAEIAPRRLTYSGRKSGTER